MARIQLVTDVSQWGLLNWPASTRRRLVLSTASVTALTIATAFASSHYILEMSTSVLVNLLLITLNMMFLLVAAFLQAVLVGDLFFSGDWRERVFLAKRLEDKDAVDLTSVNDHNAEFIVLIILAILVNAFSLNLMTGGFFAQYHDEGFFQVQMRADDPEQRIASLTSIADPNNNRLWDRDGLRELIVDAFDDPNPDVQRQAIWTAGALQILRSRTTLREIAADNDHQDDQVRAEAAFTLGKLGRDEESRLILEELISEDHSDTLRKGAFRGLAQMGDPASVEAVVAQIDDDNDQVMAHAFWVLARIGSQTPRDRVREIVEEESHGVRRCAAMEAFKLVSTEDDATWARRQYQSTDRDEYCDAMTFEEVDERIHHVIWGESMRVKWLKTVGNTNPYEHRSWLRRVLADPEEEVHARDVAAEILRRMDPE